MCSKPEAVAMVLFEIFKFKFRRLGTNAEAGVDLCRLRFKNRRKEPRETRLELP